MIHSSIHELVNIEVDPALGPSLASAIEAQVGFFRCAESRQRPFSIHVRPYGCFSPPSGPPVHRFNTIRTGPGRWFDDPDRCVAIVRSESTLTLYANGAEAGINFYIQLFLAQSRYTMVHAGAVMSPGGGVTLLPGGAGVGKTSLTGLLVNEHGYRFMGDDIVILSSDGQCLAFPRAFMLKEHHRDVYSDWFREKGIPSRTSIRVRRTLTSRVPFKESVKWVFARLGALHAVREALRLSDHLGQVPVEQIYGRDSIALQGRTVQVVFLERYDGDRFQIQPAQNASLARRTFAILHHEWLGHMRRLWALGAQDIFDLPRYFARAAAVLEEAWQDCPCRVLLIPESALPGDIMEAWRELGLLEAQSQD